MAEPAKPGALKRQNTTSRRAQLDEKGEEIVKSGCFTKCVMKCPCVVMWVTFLVSLILSALPIVAGAITIDPVNFAGFDIPNDPNMIGFALWNNYDLPGKRYEAGDGRRRRLTEADGPGHKMLGPHKFLDPSRRSLPQPLLGGRRSEERGRLLSEAGSGGGGGGEDDNGIDLGIYFYYQALSSGPNMFSADAVAAMVEFETKTLEVPSWSTHCAKATNVSNASDQRCASPQTALRYLYRNDALEKAQCEAGFCHALMFGMPLAACAASGYGVFPCTSSIYDWRDGALAPEAEWASLLATGVCDNAPNLYAKMVLLPKTLTCTGSALSSEFARSLYQVYSPSNDSDAFVSENSAWIDTLIADLDDARSAVSATGPTDSQLQTSGKPVNVWWQAEYEWIGPDYLALLYTDLFMAIFSIALIFIIVLVNTGSILLTLAGIYEIFASIPLAMFLWMVCGQTKISIFELLGLFLILCIGADDIFVFTDTWKESAVEGPTISGTLQTRFSWTYNRAAGAMLTTTATTAFCLLLNATAPFPMLKSFGVFNAFIVICDYVLVITWYACTTVCLARLAEMACPPGKNWECSCCCPGKKDGEGKKERKVTAWFRDRLAPCLYKGRWLLIALTFALLAGGVAATATLFDDAQANQWVNGHQFNALATGHAESVVDEFGDPNENKIPVTLVYGMDDPSVTFPQSTDLFQSTYDDYTEKFEARFDADFSFGAVEQAKIVADCDAFKADADITDGAEAYCLLNDLKAEVGAAFPYADEAALRAALASFYTSARFAELEDLYTGYAFYTAFVPDGTTGIKALYNTFNSTMPIDVEASASGITQYYKPWRAAVDATCDATAPCVMLQPWGYFYWMAALQGLQDSAVQNIVIALVAAYCVLVLVTRNVLVPILAVLSIGATVTWVLATAFLANLKFDSNVAILIVMVVGMAVDYAVHLTHFYNEAEGTRYEKTQAALHGVGVSVVGGALTTAGAAIPLALAPNYMFFYQAGVFIFCVAIFGVIFSFFMLIPLFMVCGPVDETGDIAAIIRRIKGAPPPSNVAAMEMHQPHAETAGSTSVVPQ